VPTSAARSSTSASNVKTIARFHENLAIFSTLGALLGPS